MALGYRSLFTVPGSRDTIENVALGQLYSWLRHKRLNADALEFGDRASLAGGVDITLQELNGGDDSRSMRARLTERRPGETWTTTLTVHVPADPHRDPWLWLDVDAPAEKRWTARPKLAEMLLDVVEGQDGAATLSSRPKVVGLDEVDALFDVVTDPERRRLVFVAGSDDGMPIDGWVGLLSTLLRETVGLAGAYVLDAPATAALSLRLGSRFAVSPGTVRTFAPQVDINYDVDSYRHRVLTTRRILQGDARVVARALGQRAREAATGLNLPRAVSRMDQLLERQLDELTLRPPQVVVTPPLAAPLPGTVDAPEVVEAAEATTTGREPDVVAPELSPPVAEAPAVAAGPPAEVVAAPTEQLVAAEAEIFLALRQAVRDLFGFEEISLEAITELGTLALEGRTALKRKDEAGGRLSDLRDQLTEVTDERDELRRELDDERLELAATLQARLDTDRLARHLQTLVVKEKPGTDVWSEPEAEGDDLYPGSFDELLERTAELPGIDASLIDVDEAQALDARDPVGSWARKTWEILLVISDFTKARAAGVCDRDLDGYLRHTPDGYRAYSANRHARDESEDVRTTTTYSKHRMRPVPDHVDPAGEVFMGAHFKIAQSGMISPRLHYYDATNIDGKVYVGYIGRHLPTRKTN